MCRPWPFALGTCEVLQGGRPGRPPSLALGAAESRGLCAGDGSFPSAAWMVPWGFGVEIGGSILFSASPQREPLRVRCAPCFKFSGPAGRPEGEGQFVQLCLTNGLHTRGRTKVQVPTFFLNLHESG